MAVRIDCYTILLVLCVICGIAEVVTGIVAIVSVGGTGYAVQNTIANNNAGFAVAVLGAITILFGILTIIAPFKPVRLINKIFLWNYLSMGVFLIVTGLMCFGIAGALGFAVALLCWVVGIVHIVIYFVAKGQEGGYGHS